MAHVFRVGYAVETADPTEFAGLPAERLLEFQAMASNRFDQLRMSETNGFPRLGYTNVSGVPMELGWRPIGEDSVRRVAGKTVVPEKRDAWPLMQNPWIEQKLMGDEMRVHWKGINQRYDFRRWVAGE